MLTFCISTHNNLPYLKLAIKSVRKNSYYKDVPFIIHAENCVDGTNGWLKERAQQYNLEYYIDKNEIPLGIGGGMNFCAEKVQTEFIMFLHSDFYVTKNWDKACMDVFSKYPKYTSVEVLSSNRVFSKRGTSADTSCSSFSYFANILMKSKITGQSSRLAFKISNFNFFSCLMMKLLPSYWRSKICNLIIKK